MRISYVIIMLISLMCIPLAAQQKPVAVESMADVEAISDDITSVTIHRLALPAFKKLAQNSRITDLRISLHYFNESQSTDLANILSSMKGLRSLRVRHGSFSPEGYARFAKTPQLTSLAFGWAADITNICLKEIGKITSLQELTIRYGTQLANAGFAHLSGLGNLTTLRISRTHQTYVKVTGKALLPLGKLTKLREVDLSGWPADKDLFQAISKWSELRRVNLSQCQCPVNDFTGKALLPLGKLTKLREVDLSGWPAHKDLFEAISKWSELRSINLSQCQGPVDDFIGELSKLTLLTELRLRRSTISDWGLSSLSELTTLEVLDLSGRHYGGGGVVSDIGLKCLAQNKNLRELDLGGRDTIPDLGLKIIASFPSLEVLSLCSDGITPAGWALLGNSKSLQTLNIEGSSGWSSTTGDNGALSDDAVSSVAKISTLVALDIDPVNISDEGLRPFTKLKNLQSLSLTFIKDAGWDNQPVKFTGVGVQFLMQSPIISLSLNSFADMYDSSLKAGVKTLSTLEELNLNRCNKITGSFLTGFKNHKYLESISLFDCTKVGDFALQALADDGPALIKLNLQKCRAITDDGLKYLHGISSLKSIRFSATYRTVEDLDTGEKRRYAVQDKISEKAIEALRAALPECKVHRSFPEEIGWGGGFPAFPTDEEEIDRIEPDSSPKDDDGTEEQEDEF